jgi:signal transduction histidine kinase
MMKISTQSWLLIGGIALMPVLVIVITLIFKQIGDARGQSDFREMVAIYERALVEKDWTDFALASERGPRDLTLAIVGPDKRIVFSSIPGMNKGDDFALSSWNAVLHDDHRHEFSLSLPPAGHYDGYLWFFRAPARWLNHQPPANVEIMLGIGLMAAILAFAAFMAIGIVRSITRSVLLLDVATRRVASGELDTPIVVDGNDEICSLALSLNTMREEIKENNARRSRFIMGVSHDLKTPLALIKGYAEAIEAGLEKTPEEQYDHLAIIQAKADQLEGMIDDLIDFVAVDTGEWRRAFLPVGFSRWLDGFVKRSEADADLLGKTVRGEIDLPADLVVPMDERLVERAMDNLVHNALRYSGPRGTVVVRARVSGNGCRVEVADDGPGIAAADLPYIFDLFYRGSSSRREQGMGLGLAVVKTIVESHGWTIGVGSEPGEGSVFTITIPGSH